MCANKEKRFLQKLRSFDISTTVQFFFVKIIWFHISSQQVLISSEVSVMGNIRNVQKLMTAHLYLRFGMHDKNCKYIWLVNRFKVD
jgi:ABC-type histidine transport system ATPase subunit